MKTIIYHNPRCSKSREALQLLNDSTEEVEVIEYMKNPPTREELKEIVDMLGISAEDLLRKNEAVFIQNYKGKSFTSSEWIDVMATHPQLIERPIVIRGNKAEIGRPVEKIVELIRK